MDVVRPFISGIDNQTYFTQEDVATLLDIPVEQVDGAVQAGIIEPGNVRWYLERKVVAEMQRRGIPLDLSGT